MSRPELLALLADVKENPDDLTPWLVLTDWLEEYGDESDRARAEYCRLCFDRLQVKVTASDWEKGERRRELFRQYRATWLGPDLLSLAPQMRKGLVHIQNSLSEMIERFESADESARERWAWVGGVEPTILDSEEPNLLRAAPLFALARELRVPGRQTDLLSALLNAPAISELFRLELHGGHYRLETIRALAESPYLPSRLHLLVWVFGSPRPTAEEHSLRLALVERFAKVEFRLYDGRLDIE